MTSLSDGGDEDKSKCLDMVAELHIWMHKQAHSSIGQTHLVWIWNVQLKTCGLDVWSWV